MSNRLDRRRGWLGLFLIMLQALVSGALLAGGGTPTTRLVFPQIASGGGFQAELLLRNLSDREIRGTIMLRQGSGEALDLSLNGDLSSQFGFVLPPRGVLRYETEPNGEVSTGYAIVEASVLPPEISGTVVYRFAGSEVSVGPSPEAFSQAGFIQTEQLDLPNAEGDREIKMGVALVNPNQEPLAVHFRILDQLGIPRYVTDRLLEPGEHRSLFLDDPGLFGSELAPESGFPNPFQGSLEVTSRDGAFAMTLLRMRLPSGRLANLGARPLESAFAITHVTVIPMHTDDVLPDQTVLVRNGRIERMDSSDRVEVPSDAVIIDGTGRYLIPGLADMHVHQGFRSESLLFLANGVTTVREMWGSPGHVAERDLVERGDILGPRLLVAGPGIDGNPPTWPRTVILEDASQAEAEVAKYQAAGYDYIKIYNNLDAAPYQAVVQAAGARGMRLVGHIPWQVGPEAAIATGQYSLEHLVGLSPLVTTGASQSWWSTYLPASGRQLAERFLPRGIWNCPTISTNVAISLTPEERQAILDSPEIRFMVPQRVANWIATQWNQFTPSQRAQLISNMQQFLLALHQAGAPLLVGTDSGFPMVLPGFSIHDELRLFVEAGLTPLETLRIATWNAAVFSGRTDEFGAVREGLVADLLLLEKNPLSDVGNLTDRVGVMVRGRWLPEAELQRRLEELASSFQAGTAGPSSLHSLGSTFSGHLH